MTALPVFSRIPASRPTPRAVSGRWRQIKTAVMLAIFAAALLLPQLRYDRGEGVTDRAVLFDFMDAKAFVFGWTFGPQDLILLLSLLLGAAFFLFFTNTLVGRVWCGFTCPQTVWTDLFVMIERWTTPRVGPASAVRKILKHSAFAAVSLLTGLTIVAYFTDLGTGWSVFFAGEAGVVTLIFVIVFSGLTYLLAGHARELVCLHMCPWPRFQAAMSDARTLVVTYDLARGEPRGPLKRAADSAETGDCVDCGLCVAVCPTGIDIRNGAQLGCIGCGLCADACDPVMEKVKRPKGLIAFMAEAPAAERPAGIRWKPAGFAALTLAAALVFTSHLFGRSEVDIAVAPERHPPFVQLSDGTIRNIYMIRIADRRPEGAPLKLVAEGIRDAELALALGADGSTLIDPDTARAGAAERVTLTAPAASLMPGRQAVTFRVVNGDTGEELATVQSYFWAPETAP